MIIYKYLHLLTMMIDHDWASSEKRKINDLQKRRIAKKRKNVVVPMF